MFTVSPSRSVVAASTVCVFAVGALAIVGDAIASQDASGVPATNAAPTLIAQALAYEHGEGVPKDAVKAAALYCEAARDGDPEAQFSLGWMYANGRGVALDNAVAAALFAKAAAAGHTFAQGALQFVGAEPNGLPDCMRPAEPVIVPAPQPGQPPDPFIDLPPHKREIAQLVAKLAPSYAVNPRLALAVIAIESNFEPKARSPKDARGLMQLIPDTAARFNVKNVFDARDNIRGGLAYLRWLLSYYRGQVILAVAAYNAGEKAVDKYRGIPPYPETRNYVRRVLDLFGNERHPYDPKLTEPSSFLVPLRAGEM